MLRILLPTDFSENAKRAIDFVLHHFKNEQLKLFLIHTIKAPNSAAGVLIRIDDLMRKDAEVELEALEKYIQEKYNLHVESIIKIGHLKDWINSYAKSYQIDLIAMGTKGENNVTSKFLGSVTESVIRTSKLPLLAIPSVENKPQLEHIAIASADDKLLEEQFLTKVFNNLKNSSVKINAVKVRQQNERSTRSIEMQGKQIRVEEVVNDSVVEGLNEYIDEVPTDILVLYHARNSKFDYFFNRSITKNICGKTKVPLLVIPAS